MTGAGRATIMAKKIIIKNNPTVTEVKYIQQVCEPLKILGVTDFYYTRKYNDYSIIDLSTHAEWHQLFFSNLLSKKYQVKDVNSHLFTKTYLKPWSDCFDTLIFQEGRQLFDVNNGITLYHKNEHFEEFCSFFSTKKDNPSESYLAKVGIFEKFIAYFKDKTKLIALKSEVNKMTIPSFYHPKPNLDKSKETNEFLSILDKQSEKSNFDNTIFPKLTKKETECLYWLSMGKSAIETGIILNCSKRTIETHLNSIKFKTGSTRLTSLIYKAVKIGII